MESTPARSIRASSGSLSSPTPSPPRQTTALPPPANQTRVANKQARRTGLESGSDSSELTDEDEVALRAKKKGKRGRKPRKQNITAVDKEPSSRRAHSRGTSESTANGAHGGSGSGGTSVSGSQAQSTSRSSRRSGVIVPPTMWEWAYKKNKPAALGLDIAPNDDSSGRSQSSGPERKAESAQLSEGEIEDPPATSTSEPPPKRHDKPLSARSVAIEDVETPVSGPNTNATTPRPSPTPIQPETKKPSPTPDDAQSVASDQNPDETKSDVDVPIDEPEPEPPKAAEPEPEPEDEPAPEDDSKASIELEQEEPEPEPEPEPGPEPEAEIEADPEMQPPHRAEALDVLAAMEVRFAELRERLYADKMEEAAKEEAMILDGTHPELVFLQRELDDRRARRKQLAETRRALEIGWCATIRRAEEAAAWSEWRNARDELRDSMRTEFARKRRRLEREKRAAERPPNVRPIPPAPQTLPPPPSLRSLLKLHANPQRAPAPLRATPSLTPLSYAEAVSDLEQMTPRRAPFYQPQMSYASEEEAYARSRGYPYRSNGPSGSGSSRAEPGPQYPPALVHSYVVAPAPAWDGSTGRRREPRDAPRIDRERMDRIESRDPREALFDSPLVPATSDKDDRRPSSSAAWSATGELDPWDRDQTREWQRRMERDAQRERERDAPRDIPRDRERERDRPLTTPFTMQPFVSASADVEMGTAGSRPLSRNVDR